MLVRWGVRLVDDSYLWLSEPQRVGDITLGNADRVSAVVTTSSSRFTGITSREKVYASPGLARTGAFVL